MANRAFAICFMCPCPGNQEQCPSAAQLNAQPVDETRSANRPAGLTLGTRWNVTHLTRTTPAEPATEEGKHRVRLASGACAAAPRTTPLQRPLTQCPACRSFAQLASLPLNLRRNPASKRDGSECVAALGCVHLFQCVQSVRREDTLKSRESWP